MLRNYFGTTAGLGWGRWGGGAINGSNSSLLQILLQSCELRKASKEASPKSQGAAAPEWVLNWGSKRMQPPRGCMTPAICYHEWKLKLIGNRRARKHSPWRSLKSKVRLDFTYEKCKKATIASSSSLFRQLRWLATRGKRMDSWMLSSIVRSGTTRK